MMMVSDVNRRNMLQLLPQLPLPLLLLLLLLLLQLLPLWLHVDRGYWSPHVTTHHDLHFDKECIVRHNWHGDCSGHDDEHCAHYIVRETAVTATMRLQRRYYCCYCP